MGGKPLPSTMRGGQRKPAIPMPLPLMRIGRFTPRYKAVLSSRIGELLNEAKQLGVERVSPSTLTIHFQLRHKPRARLPGEKQVARAVIYVRLVAIAKATLEKTGHHIFPEQNIDYFSFMFNSVTERLEKDNSPNSKRQAKLILEASVEEKKAFRKRLDATDQQAYP